MWTTSLDLTDAYFHIPISTKFHKFLRFVWEDRVYAFKMMPFGLSIAPLIFSRMFQAVVAHLHSKSLFTHSYLDESLLKNMSQFLLRDHAHFVIGLLLNRVSLFHGRLHFSRGTLLDIPGAIFFRCRQYKLVSFYS
jgi:hypothetical protein